MTPRPTRPRPKNRNIQFQNREKNKHSFFQKPHRSISRRHPAPRRIVHLKSFGISPDRRSKQAFSNRHFFTLIHADNLHLLKRRTRLFQAPNRETRPRSRSTGGTPIQKSQKALSLTTQIMRISPLYATTTWSMSK